MKKLPALLNTPARVVIALGLIVLGSEVLIMVLIEIIHATLLKDDYLASVAWKFVDPIALTAMVAPALYFLIFRPLNQQAELERQLDELHRFQKVTVGRELRMKELAEEIAALRNPSSTGPAGDLTVTSGSLEAPRDEYATTQPTEQRQRDALLFMLEDLESTRRKVEQAHQEWISALDVVNDPIFLHDKQFRILRCNKAYQQCAGLPFKQIIDQPYYEIFPKTGAPLAGCLRVMEKAEAATDVEEMVVGDTIYRSRTYSVYGEQRAYLHSVHILEDITERKRTESALRQSQERLRNIIDGLGPSMFVGLLTTEGAVLEANQQALAAAGLKPEDVLGKPVEETYWFSYSEESKRQMRESIARAARGEALRYDVQIRAAENQYIPLDFSLQPFRDTTGRVVLLVPSAIVITERKRAEVALSTSEARLALTIASAELATWDWNIKTGHDIFNERWAEMRGYRLEEIEPHVSSWEKGVNPDDLAAMGTILEEHFEGHTPFFQAEYRVQTKSGSWIWMLDRGTVVERDADGNPLRMAGIEIDITERKQAEAMLRESEARIRNVFEQANDGIYIITADNRYLDANPSGLELLGYTRDELLQMGVADVLAPHEVARLAVEPPRMMSGVPHLAEWEHVRKDGSMFPGEVSARRLNDHSYLAIVRDLTERRHAEAALRESEAKFRTIIESSPVALAVNDERQNVTLLNRKFSETFGYTLADIPTLAEWWPRAYPDPVYRQRVAQEWQAAVEKAQRGRTELEPLEYKVTCKDGTVRDIRFSMAPIGASSLVIFYDVTERKLVEETLKKSEALLSEMGRMAKVGGWEFDARTGDGTWTEEVARIHDMYPQEGTSRDIGLGFYQGESKQKIEAAIKAAIADGTPYDLELELVTAKGNHKWVRTIARPVKEEGKVRGSFQDITERKQAEVAMQHANRALSTLSAVNRNLVHASDENELLQAICDAIVEQKGYRMAWVGYVQHDESKSIRIMARAGYDAGYLDTAQISWGETEHGMGPSGRAARSGATQLCQDIANDPHYSPWREAALKRGYAASIGLPLLEADETVFGILNVYATETNAFTPKEVGLLEEMAGDLAFGVRGLHTRRERDLALEQSRLHFEKLRNSLEDTVRAIATIVEMRDPYTAGHQVRVADLAAAIAKQMVLPEEQIHAIHLAGVVHDLGKIKVPAEILSKPGRINDLEFGLIKVHPQAGYDILKGIDFPWPIAQMVWQHHERLDGSGYPQGLKGEAILLEARILAVADVVEAISTHRPYRPGLGIEVALAEITKQRGVHYDPRVVDGCVALFREQHYSFTS